MMLPFGPLEKDRAGLDTGLLTIAKNCYPSTIGYVPMPGLAEHTVPALPADCKGFFATRDKVGAAHVFCGTTSKLYKLGGGTWVDYTRAVGGNYAVPAGCFWQFAKYDSKVVAVNGFDANQIIDIDAGATKFTAQGGSPPVARFAFTVGDFMWLVDANNRRRLLCSGFNDPEFWTIGSQLSDEFIMPDGGNIAGPALLGSFGIIIQDGGAARRLIYVEGDPDIAWRLEEIQGITPALNGYSVISAKGLMFYLGENGPHSLAIDGSNRAIGEHRVAKEFLQNCDSNRMEQFLGFADPYSSRIYWAYYKSAGSTVFDGLLGYDVELDRLFFAGDDDRLKAQFFAPVIVPGLSLDELDTYYASIDAMTDSLDSRRFQGGRPTIGAVNSNRKLALLAGSSLEATLEIAPMQLNPDGRAIVTEVDIRGKWGDASPTLMIGKQEYSGGAIIWSGPYVRSSRTGITYTRDSARIHTFRVTIPGNTSWEFAQALYTTEQPDGRQ